MKVLTIKAFPTSSSDATEPIVKGMAVVIPNPDDIILRTLIHQEVSPIAPFSATEDIVSVVTACDGTDIVKMLNYPVSVLLGFLEGTSRPGIEVTIAAANLPPPDPAPSALPSRPLGTRRASVKEAGEIVLSPGASQVVSGLTIKEAARLSTPEDNDDNENTSNYGGYSTPNDNGDIQAHERQGAKSATPKAETDEEITEKSGDQTDDNFGGQQWHTPPTIGGSGITSEGGNNASPKNGDGGSDGKSSCNSIQPSDGGGDDDSIVFSGSEDALAVAVTEELRGPKEGDGNSTVFSEGGALTVATKKSISSSRSTNISNMVRTAKSPRMTASGEAPRKQLAAKAARKPASTSSASTTNHDGNGSKLKLKMPKYRKKLKTKMPNYLKGLEEIIECQKSTKNLIPRSNFQDELDKLMKAEGRRAKKVSNPAKLAMQEVAEAHSVGIFEDAQLCAIHSDRITVQAKDMKLVEKIKGDGRKYL